VRRGRPRDAEEPDADVVVEVLAKLECAEVVPAPAPVRVPEERFAGPP
jgi:hypothetical protein